MTNDKIINISMPCKCFRGKFGFFVFNREGMLSPGQTESQVNTTLDKGTCVHRLVMGGQTDSQVDASYTQVAKKPFQCSLARAPVPRKTKLKPTCVDSRWVANCKRLQKLHLLACKFELDQSGQNSLQAIASPCKPSPN